MIDAKDLHSLYNAAVTVQDAVGELVEQLAAVLPEPEPSQRPAKVDDPIRSQTIRLPASVWHKLRLLAAAKGSTSIGELRAALEAHLEREWPQVRARMDAVDAA